MCLILLAFERHPDFPVIIGANRDEFYRRPSQVAHFWPDAPQVLAGRDEEAGGTWCGVDTKRRFAAVTNFREPPTEGDFASRGDLVADFLKQDVEPDRYLTRVATRADDFRGFNLLVGDARGIHYCSNRGAAPTRVAPGVHGLSNDLINVPWFKVTRGKHELATLLSGSVKPDALFEILANEDRPPDNELPDTGFGRRWERLLSSSFIRTEEYGTRSSTVILIDRDDNLSFHERTFRPGDANPEERSFVLRADAPAAHIG